MRRLLGLAVAAATCACNPGLPDTNTSAAPAFPATTERTGVTYFTLSRSGDSGRFSAVAHGPGGEPVATLDARSYRVFWPGQHQSYFRPLWVRMSSGDDSIEVHYLPETSVDRFSAVVGDRLLGLRGNPAYPARCHSQPSLGPHLDADESRALAAWIALLPDLSTTIGTVQRRWTSSILSLNRASNLTAALCCLSGDVGCCGTPPFGSYPTGVVPAIGNDE